MKKGKRWENERKLKDKNMDKLKFFFPFVFLSLKSSTTYTRQWVG
jgi:hypothetical protein